MRPSRSLMVRNSKKKSPHGRNILPMAGIGKTA
jgi:hypothetical protein